jgi:cbb3-type cytochrome oxidase subunit 3
MVINLPELLLFSGFIALVYIIYRKQKGKKDKET